MRSFPKKEGVALTTLFFAFGFLVMALAPRFPDLKANLGVTYGTFGTLVGFGTFGAFLSLMTVGHVIHKVGTFPILIGSAAVMIGCFTTISNTHSPIVFFFANFIFGMSWSSYHISINTQSMHRQRELGVNAIPFLHGTWTLGAVTSALVSTLISESVSLAWHMNTLGIFIGTLMLTMILTIRSRCIPSTDVADVDGAVSFFVMIKSFRIDLVISAAYLSVVMIEISIGDWSALFSRDLLGLDRGIAIIPYLFFMTAMIAGRFGYHQLMKDRNELIVVRVFIFVGGGSFTVLTAVASLLAKSMPTTAFFLLILAFFAGGLGSSFLGPYIFSYVVRRSPLPDSVALAELTATNTALTFLFKLALAWIAEAAGLAFALVIPGVAFFLVAFYIEAVLKSPAKS